jgi:hypothetical protein
MYVCMHVYSTYLYICACFNKIKFLTFSYLHSLPSNRFPRDFSMKILYALLLPNKSYLNLLHFNKLTLMCDLRKSLSSLL